MVRVDQQQGEAAVENVPDGLPQHTGGFQGHMRHRPRFQVVRQGPQIPGHGPKGPHFGSELPVCLAMADGTLNRLEVNVQPRYRRINGVHEAPPPRSACRRGTSRGRTLCSTCSPTTGATITGACRRPGQTPKRAQGSNVRRPPTRRPPPLSSDTNLSPFSSFRVPRSGMTDSKAPHSMRHGPGGTRRAQRRGATTPRGTWAPASSPARRPLRSRHRWRTPAAEAKGTACCLRTASRLSACEQP